MDTLPHMVFRQETLTAHNIFNSKAYYSLGNLQSFTMLDSA